MNFFRFKDGRDFLDKTGMSTDEAIKFLDQELIKKGYKIFTNVSFYTATDKKRIKDDE